MIVEDTIADLNPTMRSERHRQHAENDGAVASSVVQTVDERQRSREAIVPRAECRANREQRGRDRAWVALWGCCRPLCRHMGKRS